MNKDSSNVVVITSAVVAVVVVAILATVALVCYLRKMACFGIKEGKSNSEFEATTEMWGITESGMNVTMDDPLYSRNSDIAEDPFISLME